MGMREIRVHVECIFAIPDDRTTNDSICLEVMKVKLARIAIAEKVTQQTIDNAQLLS